MCRVEGLCVREKERNGAREGVERSSQMGLLECELKRRPPRGVMVGSSAQSLKRPSVPIEAMRLGWIVGGSHWILLISQLLSFDWNT